MHRIWKTLLQSTAGFFSVNGIDIHWLKTVTYLGVSLKSGNKLHINPKHRRTKFYQSFNNIFSKARKSGETVFQSLLKLDITKRFPELKKISFCICIIIIIIIIILVLHLRLSSKLPQRRMRLWSVLENFSFKQFFEHRKSYIRVLHTRRETVPSC